MHVVLPKNFGRSNPQHLARTFATARACRFELNYPNGSAPGRGGRSPLPVVAAACIGITATYVIVLH